MDLEGELNILYDFNSRNLINILLENGYTLSMELQNDNKELKVLYYKRKENK